MAKRFFEDKDHAALYKEARPQYTDKVFDVIFNYCQDVGCSFQVAVDVACGSGHQSTVPLLERFRKVIGCDISEEQLSHAPAKVNNLCFIKSPAENLSFLKSGTIDLVSAATCLHWFDIPKFFKEVIRVLSPGGCLAVYGYGWFYLLQEDAQTLLEEFIVEVLASFHHEGNLMVMSGYTSIDLPFPIYKRQTIDCEMEWNVDRLCGFIASTSLWQRRLKVIPDCDSLEKLSNGLMSVYQKSNGEINPTFTVVFPVTILLGQKPKARV